ncbi:polysaccharide ABC transporter ATP-binding protein [Aerolutibacter ruishenii]|uniref:Lipopolysaccharide transport system ATP-binding protein n=1 Tax=Aerolutibacter ruishenii TaxID=686800 RepID=A0A562M2W0_9GAMM|nr:polysaccharide ABC transporter ATP-binding protein [Lysobacter ruishenii]TWI14266.1 lipopolysaccharide transport system ATP-binding protein [Lysobacter ruishenii]
MQPALSVRDVSKTYRLWATPASRLWVPLLYRLSVLIPFPLLAGWLRKQAAERLHYHQALRALSFTLGRGEALGIIGHNGSGKSTLLQIVAGVLPPSEGTVVVNGRVAALLELGSGFNPELTGRENVKVNAAILGLTPAQVRERMDDIVAFADIGDYIDEPVKTYSSGMALRLAFAVQVHTDPDILIVDEALAVGDAAFQAKAMARIDQILSRGTTLLFVGHDLNAVKAFCHRAMLLERGRIVMEGLPDEVITEYLHRTHKRALTALQDQRAEQLERIDGGYGLADACVVGATVNGGARHVALRHGDRLDAQLQVRLHAAVEHPHLIFDVLDGRGLQLTGRRIALPRTEGVARLRVAMAASFQQGIYRIRTRVVDSPALERTTVLSRQEGWLSFEVVDDSRDRFTGLFPVPMEIEVGTGVESGVGSGA